MPLKHHLCPLAFLLCITLIWAPGTTASYAIYVGKNLTADGSVMIGGSVTKCLATGWKWCPEPSILRVPRSP